VRAIVSVIGLMLMRSHGISLRVRSLA